MLTNKNFFKNQTILITGGTGSFGKAFVNFLLQKKYVFKKLIIFSRDELKQFEMSKQFTNHNIRFFLGDIRDKDRLKLAIRDVDILIHAAALKQVPAAEYNPIEFIKTNILGSQNIIEALMDSSVKKVIALSTDKASSPANLYGATKLCSDKLFISVNNILGKQNIKFSVVRYGNVFGSRGSVVPTFLELKKKVGHFNLTHPEMTRFNITLDEAINFVIFSIKIMKGAEIFVPKIPSFYIRDLAAAMDNNLKIKITGIREGEKLHEEMISRNESRMSFQSDDCYVVTSPKSYNFYLNSKFKKVIDGFEYRSDNNEIFLNPIELKKIFKSYLTNNLK